MIVNLYVVFDVVADSTVVIGSAPNEQVFIRQNLPYLAKINSNYESEFVVKKVGTYKESTCEISACEIENIPWNSYSPTKPDITPQHKARE